MGSTTAAYKHAFSASLAFGLLALQFGVIRWSPGEAPVRIVLPLTIALVPVALWPYRGRVGVWVMFVGMLANLAVIVANGGLMPITRATVVDAVGAENAAQYQAGDWITGSKDVLIESGEGHAVALGDSIIIRVGTGGFAASPGDIVIWAGLVVLAAEASIAWQRRPRTDESAPAEAPREPLRFATPATRRRRYRRVA